MARCSLRTKKAFSKYRCLDDRRQYAVQGYTDSKLEEQERETGELYEERIKEA